MWHLLHAFEHTQETLKHLSDSLARQHAAFQLILAGLLLVALLAAYGARDLLRAIFLTFPRYVLRSVADRLRTLEPPPKQGKTVTLDEVEEMIKRRAAEMTAGPQPKSAEVDPACPVHTVPAAKK